MSGYVKYKKIDRMPRIPLTGTLDLTYRCRNNCRHCWLRIPPVSEKKTNELTVDEIKELVDEAGKMGCRKWNISGGEPMLRPDFSDIFDYITRRTTNYTLNTNGTLITPRIAKLLRRRGLKLVALYGADEEVHDHITRNPGSFAAVMQGIAYLQEAGANFTIQLVPLKDNYHQLTDMIRLAESLAPNWRIGASWLYLSAAGDDKKNNEIRRQRLSPKEVVDLDKLDPARPETPGQPVVGSGLLASCIHSRNEFHVDAYGQMSFCSFIKDQSQRCDLRKVSFVHAWEDLIPAMSRKIKSNAEYKKNCGSCSLRSSCRWCPVFAYLEHKNYSAKVEYLCAVAEEQKNFEETWQKTNRRFFRIAGVTIQLDSDLPYTDDTFHPRFKPFQVEGPGEDNITIRHHFSPADLNIQDPGKEIYRSPPWAIYRKGNSWVYLCLSSAEHSAPYVQAAVFTHDYSRNRIYNDGIKKELFLKGNLTSLTLMPSDQLFLAQVLADREACFFHSSGMIFESSGLLFMGHSGAGKSTITSLLQDEVEILCDDRVIVRNWPAGFKIHGTWSHGDIPIVSSNSAPLRAVMFLQKAKHNQLVPIKDKQLIIGQLLSFLVKPLPGQSWWEKILDLVEKMMRKVPCYFLYFNKSEGVKQVIREKLGSTQKEPVF